MAGLAADLTVRAGDRRIVTAQVAAARGQFVAIVGPSGAGKSTLLRALAGLQPFDGTAQIDQLAPASSPADAIARVLSYTPHHVDVAFAFRAHEIVALGRHVQRDEQAALDARVTAALQAVALLTVRDQPWPTLSAGEQKRIALAQALCQDAPWMLLDEPTSSLDPAHAKHVMELLAARAAAGCGVVAITHDIHWAARYATHAWLLRGGEVVASGPAPTVLTPPLLAQVFGVNFVALTSPRGMVAE